MRVIDRIWTEVQYFENENKGESPKLIKISNNITDKLLLDFEDLYEVDNASFGDLENYFGIKIKAENTLEEISIL